MESSLSAEVSLHCIICFDEFDVKDKPPVVLPCGHTYVCCVCAKRLKTCMECREPLFWTPKQAPVSLPSHNRSPAAPARYTRSARYSPGHPQTPPHPSMMSSKPESQPLPLPKNVVLLGMIESAKRQARLIEEAAMEEDTFMEAADGCPVATEAVFESKLNPILAGMSAFVGTCGTYVVREAEGLPVLPFDPNRQHHKKEEEKKTDDCMKEPFMVEEGQSLQVVSVEEGVYRLARETGFIVASANQIVKVGGPNEESCKLEGMLQSVLKKKGDVQQEMNEVDMLVNKLRAKIDTELKDGDGDHQVISDPVPKVIPEAAPSLPTKELPQDGDTPTTPTNATPGHHDGHCDNDGTTTMDLEVTDSMDSTEVAVSSHHPRTPAQNYNRVHLHSPAHSCPMPDRTLDTSILHQPFMDGTPAGLPRYRVQTEDDLGPAWGFGCGTSLFGERLLEGDPSSNLMALSFDESLVEVGGNTSVGSRTSNGRPQDASLRSGSFDGPINFRTGMSGHTGLNRYHRPKPEGGLSRSGAGGRMMMSEHRGIATLRGSLQRRTIPHEEALGLEPRSTQHQTHAT